MQLRLTFKTRLRLAALAAIMIPAATAAPALAHDALSSTNPAQDAVVAAAPETVSLTLSEPPTYSKSLNLSIITVTDGAGNTVGDGKVTVYGPSLSTKIAAGTAGTYKVRWRAVSSDGHPIEGKFSFTVQPAAGQGAVPSTTGTTPSAAPPTAPAAIPSVPEPVKPPNNENAPLVLGIVGVILAAAVGSFLVIRNRRNNTRG